MNKLEIREFNEVRAVDNEDGKMIVEGTVNNVGEWSKMIYGSFKERVSEGAFKRAFERAKDNKRDIFFLALHNTRSLPIASVNSGTMELKEEKKKVTLRAELPDTTQNRDIYALVKAGVLREFSFGFNNAKCDWDKDADGIRTRTINDLDISEISLVCTGAYNNTGAEARGYNACEEIEALEQREIAEKENEELYKYNKNKLRLRGVK